MFSVYKHHFIQVAEFNIQDEIYSYYFFLKIIYLYIKLFSSQIIKNFSKKNVKDKKINIQNLLSHVLVYNNVVDSLQLQEIFLRTIDGIVNKVDRL